MIYKGRVHFIRAFSLLFLVVLFLVISAFWFCFSFFVSACMGRKNISCFYLKIPCLWYWSFVGTEFEFHPDEILHCCRLSVPECLSIRFLRPVSRTRMRVGLVCFLRLFRVCSGRIRHFSEIFFHLFPSVFWWC